MTKEQLLDSTDAFLFDLDGTVYLDETPIGDVKGTLARLRALKKRVVFVTNNSSKTEEEYRKKLSRIGILGEGDLIYTSAMAAAEHVSAHFPKKRVFLLATDAPRSSSSPTIRASPLQSSNASTSFCRGEHISSPPIPMPSAPRRASPCPTSARFWSFFTPPRGGGPILSWVSPIR